MNIYGACIYRLAEKGIISLNAAKALNEIFQKGGLTELQLAEGSGLPIDEVVPALNELYSLGAVMLYGAKYFCPDKGEALLSLMQREELLAFETASSEAQAL